VLSFVDAPNYPNSGELAADIFSRELKEAGFILVNRADLGKIFDEQQLGAAGAIKPEEAAQLGRQLGADILLTGAVSESGQRKETQAAMYSTEMRTWVNPDGSVTQIPETVLVRPEESYVNTVFSCSARLTFVEEGSIAWLGSGSGTAVNGTLQQAAEAAVKKMSKDLFREILKTKTPL